MEKTSERKIERTLTDRERTVFPSVSSNRRSTAAADTCTGADTEIKYTIRGYDGRQDAEGSCMLPEEWVKLADKG
jgi:hypothetical protein